MFYISEESKQAKIQQKENGKYITQNYILCPFIYLNPTNLIILIPRIKRGQKRNWNFRNKENIF